MAGCISCFVVPLLLFIFHRYIQPLILKFWNPWAKPEDKLKTSKETKIEAKTDEDKGKYSSIHASTELNNECCARG